MLALLNPRPAILVYAREATYLLLSGVLELECYDVIVDPFSDETLRGAVLNRGADNAAKRAGKTEQHYEEKQGMFTK